MFWTGRSAGAAGHRERVDLEAAVDSAELEDARRNELRVRGGRLVVGGREGVERCASVRASSHNTKLSKASDSAA
jgi:hypothetical protein